jgi:hypothetical protein
MELAIVAGVALVTLRRARKTPNANVVKQASKTLSRSGHWMCWPDDSFPAPPPPPIIRIYDTTWGTSRARSFLQAHDRRWRFADGQDAVIQYDGHVGTIHVRFTRNSHFYEHLTSSERNDGVRIPRDQTFHQREVFWLDHSRGHSFWAHIDDRTTTFNPAWVRIVLLLPDQDIEYWLEHSHDARRSLTPL